MSGPIEFVLTEEQAKALPTEEDVAFYEEHGWYIADAVIPEEIVDNARNACERVHRGERDWVPPVDSGYVYWKAGDGGALRNNEFISLQVREFRELTNLPIISAIAARLARTAEIRLMDDQLVYKMPTPDPENTTNVGWHIDKAYCSTCTSNKMLTAWIPLHDCPVEFGPIEMIDGSHLWPGTEHYRFFNRQDQSAIEQELREAGHELNFVPLELKKGQVSFHHCQIVHGSRPNYSDSPRITVNVQLQDKDNRYQKAVAPNGEPVQMINEVMARKQPNGDPDFSDTSVFPVLWSEES